MRVMNIDCYINETNITVKDLDKQKVLRKHFKGKSPRELLEQIEGIANSTNVDEIHVETAGFGKVVIDYLIDTKLAEKVKQFNYCYSL